MSWTETLQILELCRALIRFIGSIRVRDFRVKRQTRVIGLGLDLGFKWDSKVAHKFIKPFWKFADFV